MLTDSKGAPLIKPEADKCKTGAGEVGFVVDHTE